MERRMGDSAQIIRKRILGSGWTGFFVLLCLLLSAWAEAGVPVISNQRVTDVATRSFSVIGTVSASSTVVFSLYSSNCTTPATGFATSLQQNTTSGNIRFTVTGLSAATTYCYQLSATSASSELATTLPAQVTTATAVTRTMMAGLNLVPIGNDILRMTGIHLPSGETRDGILVTLDLLGGSAISPLSLLLSGDPNRDYFNLNNLFVTATGTSLDLMGGERMRITEIHGTSGCVIERYRTIPADGGATVARPFTRANPSDIDASGVVNILDVLRVVAGKGTATTGSCFNSDLDLNASGGIDSTSFTTIKGGFNGLP